MVSLITDGSSTDADGRPFARRRKLPWLVLVAVVALLGIFVWAQALTKDETSTAPMSCNSPRLPASAAAGNPTPPTLGKRVGYATLVDVEPAALWATKVRVFNANGETGQAAHVASQLNEYGFASAPDVQVGNDPIYVDGNMECTGQIRFGANGRAAAASLQLVVPCAELIEDQRQDDIIDLALGNNFNKIAPNSDAEEVLRALKDPPVGTAPAPQDVKLLAAARTAKC
ncbi:envelope integrity protein Cei [Antrihabitans sp. YC2-6]|uniref:envelope integrity protein Cei n=1 Tax=Antrihabitans sp. YC2-6 TaxID=2799498 RepID=UPI0018F5739E|nr:envelope integrity protein Cei [Antrihabitans sp. YC2-6]MBJ8345067.1 envelope integrity protein Cei [Antrihabitans sp. YC2-6]